MKYSHLLQIVNEMQRFNQIGTIYRQNDTQISIEFHRNNIWTFDMSKNNSQIFCAPKSIQTKSYQAPFDVLLSKHFTRSTLQSVTLHNNDKIIRIIATQSGSYKSQTSILQFEFTGKHTNVIIMDSNEIVLEALRHIDENTSVRCVKVGQILENPPKATFVPKEYPLQSVEDFLHSTYVEYAASALSKLKHEKSILLSKRIAQYQLHLDALHDEQELFDQAAHAQNIGHILLANLHRIRGYETSLKLEDFEGKLVTITPPSNSANGSDMANYFFKLSKKLKQKGMGQFQERRNLNDKIHYLQLFTHTIQTATAPDEIHLLFPQKTSKNKAKAKTSEGIDEFWIEGNKVSLGKSEKGNIELLRRSRARDIWLHLKDRPSAHVVITTDKQELPARILQAAAKLCVDFSVFEKGSYLVDYTPRREVRIQEGANVLYTKYTTLSVQKS
jgi:predicted ribosome quality control (RQC) complex YloA/Tae2 family protein